MDARHKRIIAWLLLLLYAAAISHVVLPGHLHAHDHGHHHHEQGDDREHCGLCLLVQAVAVAVALVYIAEPKGLCRIEPVFDHIANPVSRHPFPSLRAPPAFSFAQ